MNKIYQNETYIVQNHKNSVRRSMDNRNVQSLYKKYHVKQKRYIKSNKNSNNTSNHNLPSYVYTPK